MLSGSTALTVALVPTATKAGVWIVPCGVRDQAGAAQAPGQRGADGSKPKPPGGPSRRARDCHRQARRSCAEQGDGHAPAVEVRSTPSLIRDRAWRRPRRSAASSSGAMPPSGPTTTSTVAGLGQGDLGAAACVASSCSTSARSAAATGRATWSVVIDRRRPPGSRSRRDCLAASRAVACHLASARSPRSPDQRTIERDACQGTIAATPISVSISTASSDAVALGQRLDDDEPSGRLGRRELLGDLDAPRSRSADRDRPGRVRRARVRRPAPRPLAEPDPAHHGGVPALGPPARPTAADGSGSARSSAEDGSLDRGSSRAIGRPNTAGRSLTGEGVPQPAEDAACRASAR